MAGFVQVTRAVGVRVIATVRGTEAIHKLTTTTQILRQLQFGELLFVVCVGKSLHKVWLSGAAVRVRSVRHARSRLRA